MKNGFNVSGVSEMVHEFKVKPQEAQIDFSAKAVWREDQYALAIQTINAGTIRIPRAFGFDLRPFNGFGAVTPDPQEALLLALGSCVLVTYVQGCSARGITLNSLEVQAEGTIARLGDPQNHAFRKVGSLKVKVDIDCEGAPEAIKEIAQFAGCFSPNHRTFIEDNNPGLQLTILDGSSRSFLGEVELDLNMAEAKMDLTGGPRTVSAKSIWKYGVQIDSLLFTQPVDAPIAPVTAISKGIHKMEVDQPKQLGGIDKAPNPQEYLLAAMAGELITHFVRLAKAQSLFLKSVSASATGRIDLRGILNIAPVPVKIHNLHFKLEVESSASADALKQIARAARKECISFNTVAQTNDIAVSVDMGGKPLLEFNSNMRQAEIFLANMKEKMKKAQEEKEKAASPESIPFYKRVFPFGTSKHQKQGSV